MTLESLRTHLKGIQRLLDAGYSGSARMQFGWLTGKIADHPDRKAFLEEMRTIRW